MPAVYTADQLAERAACSTWLLYKLVHEAEAGTGECPFPFVRLGAKRVVFPKAPADRILGLASDTQEPT